MKPLEGIRVLDLSTFFAAPMCGRILADWGAEVIKVESPAGDPYRNSFKNQKTPAFEAGCPSFDIENANKQFICVDGKNPDGVEVIKKLACTCDVFLTNNRYNALKKMGLTYEDIRAIKPSIVYGDMSGYGVEGPLKDKPGYDYTAFLSRSGILADLSAKDESIMNTIGGFGDHVAAITLASGIAAALVKAKTTGEGDHVYTALYQSAIFLVANGLNCAYFGREYPHTRFESNGFLMTNYKCKDGEWIYLASPEYNKFWGIICKDVFKKPELLEDERFATFDVGRLHVKEGVELLSKLFEQEDSAHWVKLLDDAGVPFEKLAHFKDVLTDEQALVNKFVRPYTYASGEEVVVANTPVNFDSVPDTDFIPAGKIGADTQVVLESLGYSTEEITNFLDSGAVK